jgi:hypothetical protein
VSDYPSQRCPTLGFDPAPGDTATLERVAAAWQSLGGHLCEQADAVDALRDAPSRAGLAWQGRAAAACLDRLHVVPGDLRAAADACRTAGRAVWHYADALCRFQQRASSLEADAARQVAAAHAAAHEDDAQAAHRQLADLLRQARRLRDEAEGEARAVAAILAAARDAAPHPPGWFHRMLDDLGEELHHLARTLHDLVVRYAPVIEAVSAWCSKAASVLAEMGFCVSLVPGVGDAVGGGLILLGIGFGATALAGHTLLAAEGQESWTTVAFDGAALAVSLVSHGMDEPIAAEAEAEAARSATRAAPWRDLPSMSEREFALRAVKLHVDGAGFALGGVDLARLGEDWPVLTLRRRTGHAAASAA